MFEKVSKKFISLEVKSHEIIDKKFEYKSDKSYINKHRRFYFMEKFIK